LNIGTDGLPVFFLALKLLAVLIFKIMVNISARYLMRQFNSTVLKII